MEEIETKRRFISGKTIIGIDPAKKSHQAIIIDAFGIPVCKSFSFGNNYKGFTGSLFGRINKVLGGIDKEKVVFAVEISINLWQKLCHFLHSRGFSVIMVSPLYTKHERPKMDNTYSKSDPKDSLAVANCARQGYFNFYREYSPESGAMHRLSITYDKLKKQTAQAKQRIRSQVELIFPELNNAIDIDTDTARYLLRKYLSPEEFLNMNVFLETPEVERVSQKQHGLATLRLIKQAAENSIGVQLAGEALFAEKLTMISWLNQYLLLKEQPEW